MSQTSISEKVVLLILRGAIAQQLASLGLENQPDFPNVEPLHNAQRGYKKTENHPPEPKLDHEQKHRTGGVGIWAGLLPQQALSIAVQLADEADEVHLSVIQGEI